MTASQAFLLGLMVAWTPAFLVLAIMLWREAGVNEDHNDLR